MTSVAIDGSTGHHLLLLLSPYIEPLRAAEQVLATPRHSLSPALPFGAASEGEHAEKFLWPPWPKHASLRARATPHLPLALALPGAQHDAAAPLPSSASAPILPTVTGRAKPLPPPSVTDVTAVAARCEPSVPTDGVASSATRTSTAVLSCPTEPPAATGRPLPEPTVPRAWPSTSGSRATHRRLPQRRSRLPRPRPSAASPSSPMSSPADRSPAQSLPSCCVAGLTKGRREGRRGEREEEREKRRERGEEERPTCGSRPHLSG